MKGLRRLAAWVEGTADVTPIVPLRIALGLITVVHLLPFIADAADGITWSDRFHLPYVSWYPAVGGTAYTVLLGVAVVAALALAAGACTRVAAAATASFVVWNLFLTRTHFHHNRAYLAALLVGAALLPLGRRWSLDALMRRRRHRIAAAPVAPAWPWLLMRAEASIVYAASGISKIIDGDWWSGLVLRLRIEQHADLATSRGVPGWIIDTLSDPAVMTWVAKAIVLTEVFIGLGLVMRRTRVPAVWIAIPFHVAIEATASVQVFSILGIAALALWATPGSRDRQLRLDSSHPAARRLGRVVRRLDWLARFEILPALAGEPSIVLVDRPRTDGTTPVHTGRTAALLALSRLPLTFWPTAPLAALAVRSSRSQRPDDPSQPLHRPEGDGIEHDLNL